MEKRIMMGALLLVLVAVTGYSGEVPYNKELAEKSLAGLRVKLMFSPTPPTNAPYRLYFVRTLQVIKNDTDETMEHNLSVKIRGKTGKPGIPPEECTVYLQNYAGNTDSAEANVRFGGWMLLGGDAIEGVSDVAEGTNSP